MKKLLIYTAAVVLVGGLILWFIAPKEKANEKKDNREYATLLLQVHTEEAPDVDPEVIMEQTAECLENRLDRIVPNEFNIELMDDNRLKVNISAKEYSDTALAQRIANILERRSKLQLLTTYPNYEVWTQIESADSKDAINNESIASLISPVKDGYACLGYAHREDTAKINQMFNNLAAQSLLPKNLKPMWSIVSPSGMLELVAIRYDGKAPLDENDIESAEAKYDGYDYGAYVAFNMTKSGTIKWAELTGNNVGRQIAIVLDGCVYSYPRVNERIVGGQCSICGNFTYEEAEDLANILEFNNLPVNVSILDAALSE